MTRSIRHKAALLAALLMIFGATATPALALGVGEAAPDFTLLDTDGYSHTLSDNLGKVVFLAFVGAT